jgi:hypothetical protein
VGGRLLHSNEEVETAVRVRLRMQETDCYRDEMFTLMPSCDKCDGDFAENNALQWNERLTFKAGTHLILVTRQPFLLHTPRTNTSHTSNYILRYTDATHSVIPSNFAHNEVCSTFL